MATMEVEPATLKVGIGLTRRLTAVMKDSAGNALSGRAVTWKSSDATIAKIDPASGVVSGLANGAVTLTATSEGKSGSASAGVLDLAPVAAVSIFPRNPVIARGKTVQFATRLLDAQGNVLADRDVSWSTNRPETARIDSITGLSTAVATTLNEDFATITAEVEGRRAKATVTVTSISLVVEPLNAGAGHGCAIRPDGQPRCWGGNSQGQVGMGASTAPYWEPQDVDGYLPNWVAVSAGQLHTHGLTTEGKVWAWGDGELGKLGVGTGYDVFSPVQISNKTFVNVQAGGGFSCALDTEDTAWCWGSNDSGALGDGSLVVSRTNPGTLGGGYLFKSIAVGHSHACGLTQAGKAYCWGDTTHGQVGDGTSNPADTVRNWPTPVVGGHSFRVIAAGTSHTVAISTTGETWAWGRNGEGQLGDGTFVSSSTPVKVIGGLSFDSLTLGQDFTHALTADGKVYGWGINIWGQLGDGSMTTKNSPSPLVGGHVFRTISAGQARSFGLTAEGAIWHWGYFINGNFTSTNPAPLLFQSEGYR